jgi:hypothetical protein
VVLCFSEMSIDVFSVIDEDGKLNFNVVGKGEILRAEFRAARQ